MIDIVYKARRCGGHNDYDSIATCHVLVALGGVQVVVGAQVRELRVVHERDFMRLTLVTRQLQEHSVRGRGGVLLVGSVDLNEVHNLRRGTQQPCLSARVPRDQRQGWRWRGICTFTLLRACVACIQEDKRLRHTTLDAQDDLRA